MLQQFKTLKREVALMFVGSFALLLIVQGISYWSMAKTDQARQQADRANKLSMQLQILLSDVKDVETGLRGYVLSDDPVFLQPYDAALPRIRKDFEVLHRLIGDDEQRRNILHLRTLVQQRLEIANHIRTIQKTDGLASTRKLILEGGGKEVMDALRAAVGRMSTHESALARIASDKALEANFFSRVLFVSGFLLVLVLQCWALLTIANEINQRRLAEENASSLNVALESHVHNLDLEISERKKAEQSIHELNGQLQEQLQIQNETNHRLQLVNKELESFAYSVSHDLRSPLRGLDGLSLALLEDYGEKLDAMGKGFLERIRSESQRMGQLIDGILSLSRLTRGSIQKESINLSSLAQGILDTLAAEEPQRQVSVTVEETPAVQADIRLMEAVLHNLLSNAWKFTSKTEEGRIHFGSQFQEDGTRVFFVKDNGAGFDMTYAGKLFGAFQRLHGMNEFAGTGIGLATVQRIIHRHGGTIWAEGAVNEGAAFYFTLN